MKTVILAMAGVLLSAPAARAEYREAPVSSGASVAVQVRVTGEAPALPPQPVFKQHETCGTTIPDERLVTGAGGALRNAVVVLNGIAAGKPIARNQPVVLDNVKCAFVPHVGTATVGQMLEIRNQDPFLHDAHARLGTRTLFNVAIPKGRTVRKPLAYAGLVHINCNVRHTWMHAYLYVADHPYHAVSDAEGKVTMDQVPPGTYKLSVWHELLGSTEQPVTVEPGKTTAVTLEIPASAVEDKE
jgi:hypothetical protein